MASKKKGKLQITAEMRKLVKVGGATYVSVPTEWLRRHHLEAGDVVPVLSNNILKIVPMSEAE